MHMSGLLSIRGSRLVNAFIISSEQLGGNIDALADRKRLLTKIFQEDPFLMLSERSEKSDGAATGEGYQQKLETLSKRLQVCFVSPSLTSPQLCTQEPRFKCGKKHCLAGENTIRREHRSM